MIKPIMLSRLAATCACLLLAGCASPDPVSYKGIASSAYLKPNPQDETGHVPFRYTSQANWSGYSNAIIEPVEIYQGADNQFGEMEQDDRVELAQYMHSTFAKKLASRFQVVNSPAAGTLRIKLILTGAATNTPVLSTFARFDLAGGLYNGVQALRGREGMMSGAVIYAVEIYDATTNRLLDASVIKQYPGAYNIGASLGAMAAAEAGVEKGAEALLEQLT